MDSTSAIVSTALAHDFSPKRAVGGPTTIGTPTYIGGMFARRAPGALLLDYVPTEEPPSTPLGNALRIR